MLTIATRSLAQSNTSLLPDLDLLVFTQPREAVRYDLGKIRSDGIFVLSWLVMVRIGGIPGYRLDLEGSEGREESYAGWLGVELGQVKDWWVLVGMSCIILWGGKYYHLWARHADETVLSLR